VHEATDPTFRSVAIGSRPEDQITKLTVRFAKRSALRTGYFNKLLEAEYIYADCLFASFKPLAVQRRTIHFRQSSPEPRSLYDFFEKIGSSSWHLHDSSRHRFRLFLTELTQTCILISTWGVFPGLAVCQLGVIDSTS